MLGCSFYHGNWNFSPKVFVLFCVTCSDNIESQERVSSSVGHIVSPCPGSILRLAHLDYFYWSFLQKVLIDNDCEHSINAHKIDRWIETSLSVGNEGIQGQFTWCRKVLRYVVNHPNVTLNICPLLSTKAGLVLWFWIMISLVSHFIIIMQLTTLGWHLRDLSIE